MYVLCIFVQLHSKVYLLQFTPLPQPMCRKDTKANARDMSAAAVRDETNRQSGLGKTTFATLSTPAGYECVVIACMPQPHLCTVSVEQHMQGPGLALAHFSSWH